MRESLLNSTNMSSELSDTRENVMGEVLVWQKFPEQIETLKANGFTLDKDYSQDGLHMFSNLYRFSNKSNTKFLLLDETGQIYFQEGKFLFNAVGLLTNEDIVYGFYTYVGKRFYMHDIMPIDSDKTFVKNLFEEDGGFESVDHLKIGFKFLFMEPVSSDVYNILTGEFY